MHVRKDLGHTPLSRVVTKIGQIYSALSLYVLQDVVVSELVHQLTSPK